MSVERIKKPILCLLTLLVLILLAFSIFSIYFIQSNQNEAEVKSLLKGSLGFLQNEIENDAELYNGLLDFIKKDEVLQSAWLAKDRDALARHAAPVFEEIRSKYRVTHFYFIDQKKVCFLRMHNLSRHGDTINRFTLDGAVREGAPSHGIELGPFGTFTLRVVHPWHIGGKLIGYIELGEEIDHITPKLSETLSVEVLHTINKSYLDRVKWEEGLKMMGRTGNWDELPDLVFAEHRLSEKNLALRKHLGLLHSKHEDLLFKISLNELTYKGGFVDIFDAGGRNVADLIVLKDVMKQEASLLNMILLLVVASIITGGMIIFFFYCYLGRLEHRLVTANNGLKSEVAERKQTEKTLRKSEEQLIKTKDYLENIIERSLDSITIADKTGKITKVNKSFLKLLDLKEEEVVGKHTYDFPPTEEGTYESSTGEVIRIDKEFFNSARKMVERLFEEGKVESRESYFVRKDRKLIPVEENIVLLYNEAGEVVGSVGVIRDITERRKAEKELTEATVQLIQSEKLASLGELTAGVAHELNQPLNGIKIISQSLLRDIEKGQLEEKELGKDLKDVVNQVNKMAEIIDHMRIFTRRSEGMPREKIDINSLLDGTFKFLGQQLRNHNIEVLEELCSDLPKVAGDPIRLEQVLLNLISNARNAVECSGKGHMKIEARTYATNTNGNSSVVLELKDNGKGIPEELREKIFQPFFTTKAPGKGTGLGLSVSNKIIEEHNGKMELDSTVGEGSIFRVILPAVE